MTKSDALRKLVEHARAHGKAAETLAEFRRGKREAIALLKKAKAWEEAAQAVEEICK